MRISILGAGLIGRVIARELASEEGAQVSVFDADPDADCVVGALPGALGFTMLRSVIEAGKPIADISFSREDPLQLEALARERGSTAVVDCGVSPGLSNFFVGRAARDFNEVDDADIYVGGLRSEERR